ncbi:MAG: LptF/LptG family permease [Marinilabiliaceae bacterium]|nr:LptF/LptG family permease [Bacteroidales bacterium]MDY4519973.1 LptF/LptG family permease [Bacteroidales bacterium]
MKKLHKFVLLNYAGPLAMTFFISLFILVMQGLWRYVDDIVGKGLEISVMAELLFYVSLQVVPMALPLAILLAALMTFGNLGENYELTAMKASGISLFRIMRPMTVVTIIVCFLAFWFSNNVLPVANLKFYSLLYSVRQQRPELELKERVYYDGVDGFRIKVEHKDRETGMLYDLIIHDHRDRVNRNVNVTMADSGLMDIDSKAGMIRLVLFSGVTYDEKVALSNKRLTDRDRLMYRHDEFNQEVFQIKVDGLDFSRTSEDAFKTNDRMKNMEQLSHDRDSLLWRTDSITDVVKVDVKNYTLKKFNYKQRTDSTLAMAIDTSGTICLDTIINRLTLRKLHTQMQTALRIVRGNKQIVDERMVSYQTEHLKVNRHEMEMHRKFTLPVACLLFFFIGAPLGAIIRKGGLGTPIVISILFFIFYYVIDTFGAKMAREDVWPVWSGMWLSTSVLAVIGAFLTYKSATDSALFKSEAYARVADKIKYWIKKQREKKRRKEREQGIMPES